MRLIGRARELEWLDEAVEEVRAGGTRAVALVGEAGIGKSALLDHLAARAAPLRVLSGRAAEHEREVPFALAVEAFDEALTTLAPDQLAAIAGDLAGVLPAAGAARRPSGRSRGCACTVRSGRSSPTSRPWCSPLTTCTGPTTRPSSCSSTWSAGRRRRRICSR